MTYHNPFELLQTFAGDVGDEWCDFDEKSLRRTRRRVIAEADLEGCLRFNGTDLSKNEIATILDELDEEDKFENHRVIYKNKLLMYFLTDGDPEIFDIDDEYDIDEYCADFDLIAKPFAAQFDKLFAVAFDENDVLQIEQMSRFLVFIDDDTHLHTCFKTIERTLTVRIKEYEKLLSDIKNHEFNPEATHWLYNKINGGVDTDTLNALPSYFALQRDRLANIIDQIAVFLDKNYNEKETASNLCEIAYLIDAESLTEERIRDNMGAFEDELAQIEFAKRLEKIERVAAIAENLKQISKELNTRFVLGAEHNKLGNRLFIKGLKQQVEEILDFNEINNLSEKIEITEDLRDMIALELRKISVVSYNYSSELDISLSMIELALQIKVSPATYSILLKSKNHLIGKKPVVHYPLLDEQFRVNNIFLKPENSQTGFNQNNKSVNTNNSGTSGNSNHGQAQTRNNRNKYKYQAYPLSNYQSSEKKSWVQPAVKAACALVWVFVVAIFYFNYTSGGKFSSFNAELQKMNLSAHFNLSAKTSEKLNQVKLKRMLLPINAKTKMVDEDFYNQMRVDIKPDSFKDVNTFSWIDCRSERRPSYYYAEFKYVSMIKCDLTAVDKAQNAVVLKKTFEESSTDSKSGKQADTPPIPYKRIINYLIENSEK